MKPDERAGVVEVLFRERGEKRREPAGGNASPLRRLEPGEGAVALGRRHGERTSVALLDDDLQRHAVEPPRLADPVLEEALVREVERLRAIREEADQPRRTAEPVR